MIEPEKAGASSIKVLASDEMDGSKIKFKGRKGSAGTHNNWLPQKHKLKYLETRIARLRSVAVQTGDWQIAWNI